jgi:hypothetical protein
MTKYFLLASILLSFAFADGPGKKHWKKWHKKKNRQNKHQIHRVVRYPKSNIKIKYGFHWCFTPWRNFYPRHNHKNLVVIKNEEKNSDNTSDIFEQIEQLADLKEKNLITDKEFEKAKKDLLKRI